MYKDCVHICEVCYNLLMVVTSSKRKKLIVIISIIVVAAVLVAAGMLYASHMIHKTNLDKKAETARVEAEKKVEDVVTSQRLGGQFFVDYSVAVARGEGASAKEAYLSDDDSSAARGLECTRLFYAAVDLKNTDDIKYASDCMEKSSIPFETAYLVAGYYKNNGDADNARRFAAKAAKGLDPQNPATASIIEGLKEVGYEE